MVIIIVGCLDLRLGVLRRLTENTIILHSMTTLLLITEEKNTLRNSKSYEINMIIEIRQTNFKISIK